MSFFLCASSFPLLLTGCGDGLDGTYLFSAQQVQGRTYLMVETRPFLPVEEDGQGYFAVYEALSPDLGSWKAVEPQRTGPVYGAFTYRGADGGERLGVFHQRRVTLWSFTEDGPKDEAKPLPFGWKPETGAQLGTTLYVFGKTEQAPASHVAVAAFDGLAFKELAVLGPTLPERGFWIQAVAHQGRIHVFWRDAQAYPPLDLDPAFSFPGPVREVVFDGTSFGGVREHRRLPEGHVEAWSDGTRLRAVVQPQERRLARTPALKVFTLPEAGEAEEDPRPPYQPAAMLHFKYFTVARVPVPGREVFLRGNSQNFEVWEARADGWNVRRHPAGLPEHGVERAVLLLLTLCVAAVVLGLGMAYQRRRQCALVLEKLGTQDVLAPVSLRITAYLVDVALLVGLTELASHWAGQEAPRWSLVFLRFDFLTVWAAVYLVYLTVGEWRFGQTLGKWLLGLQVVTDQGERPPLWRALVRNLVGFFERHLLFAGVVSLPAMFLTPRRQRVGDLLGRTLVVQRAAFLRYREERAEASSAQDPQDRPDGRA